MPKTVQSSVLKTDASASAILPRIRGCLFGGAVGDALGAPVEFLSTAEIRRAFGNDGIHDFVPYDGFEGAITDDTQMTLFTAEGICAAAERGASKGIVDAPGMIRESYLSWYSTQEPGTHPGKIGMRLYEDPRLIHRRGPGRTCLTALAMGGTGTRTDPINSSKGCGGIMRAAPIGLSGYGDVFSIACDSAALTHGHPSGWLPAGCLALIVDRLVSGNSLIDALEAAIARLSSEPLSDETLRALEKAVETALAKTAPTPENVEKLGGGWTGEEALAIAVFSAISAHGDFARGVGIAVNHSGDSDSTGAIAGNILGAELGFDSIPKSWTDRVELADLLEGYSTRIAGVRLIMKS